MLLKDLPPFIELFHPESPGSRIIVRPGLLRRIGMRHTTFATASEVDRAYRDSKRRDKIMRERSLLSLIRLFRYATLAAAAVFLCIALNTGLPLAFITFAIFGYLAIVGLLPCSKIGHDGRPLGKGAFQCHSCGEVHKPQKYREV